MSIKREFQAQLKKVANRQEFIEILDNMHSTFMTYYNQVKGFVPDDESYDDHQKVSQALDTLNDAINSVE